jgi:hypothetical protein
MTAFRVNTSGQGGSWTTAQVGAVFAADATAPGQSAFPHFAGRALGNLAHPFQQRPLLSALLDAFSAEVSEIDSVLWDVCDRRDVDVAEGDQLMSLGRAVMAPVRSQYSDETNRALIDNQASAVLEGSVWANLLRYLSVHYQSVHLQQSGSAQVQISLDTATTAQLEVGWDFLRALIPSQLPAGVQAPVWMVTDGAGALFDTPGAGFDDGHFFGDLP